MKPVDGFAIAHKVGDKVHLLPTGVGPTYMDAVINYLAHVQPGVPAQRIGGLWKRKKDAGFLCVPVTITSEETDSE